MTRVQFREDDELVEYVAEQGLNPNDVAKRAFEQEVRRMKARAARSRLRKLAIEALDGAEEVRRVRDRDA